MRSVLFVSDRLAVIGLAFWAYRENYHTQEALNVSRTVAARHRATRATGWPCCGPNGPI